MQYQSDFLVIGSGLSGLSFALKAAKIGKVSLITKNELHEGASYYAQGGIASVINEEDSFEAHLADTLKAGDGISQPEIARMCVEEGPARIQELIHLGVSFTKVKKEFHLHQEGGHSKRRILHAKDQTGRSIQTKLLEHVKADPNIQVFEFTQAIDLITAHKFISTRTQNRCWGVYALNTQDQKIHTFIAPYTILATGGSGKVYLYTSNPDVATGDGVAMAYRAQISIANMEFFQFHPTCLYHPEAKSFLISEALRGEGGILTRKDGTPFMKNYHSQESLATRDVVAQAIDTELKKTGDDCVFLDIRARGSSFIKHHFPHIYKRCKSLGMDITKQPIPVVPAAHYQCGGILTNPNGKTSLGGLYAIGEVAYTGLHGANRLASNSLLEAAVFAHRAFADCNKDRKKYFSGIPTIPNWNPGKAKYSNERVVVSHLWDEIRRCMWNYVGIIRSNNRLQQAHRRISMIQEEIQDYYWNYLVTQDLIELRNIADVASIIIESAIQRKESRGLHFNIDYPIKTESPTITILQMKKSASQVKLQCFA